MKTPNLLEKNRPIELSSASSQGAPGGEVEALPTNTLQPARLGMLVLGVGFGGFLLWAGLAPLDEGVPTAGMVAIDTKRKTVQHLSGGIVKQVSVKEGQFVKQGDPLLVIDEAVSQANFESIRQHYLTLRAAESRLVAEQQGQTTVMFHPDLREASADPLIRLTMDNQQSLFLSRRAALDAALQGIQDSIRGNEASIAGYEALVVSRRSQLSLLQEELKGTRELVAEGYAPRNRQLELERNVAEISGSIADSQANIRRLKQAIAELKSREVQQKQEYRKEVATQLADIQREVQADADKLKAARDDLARTTIRSPADGQVVGLAAQTVGGVISPGQKLMDIVPRNETLLLESRVPPHMIDRVQPGKSADVRFSAFAHSPTLVVDGSVDSVSSDLITDSQTNTSYYLARVSVTPDGMQKLGTRQMQAGMPAEVVIKTGERTVLTYLLHPLTKRIAAAMKEE